MSKYKSYRITVYACKNKRKNSKCEVFDLKVMKEQGRAGDIHRSRLQDLYDKIQRFDKFKVEGYRITVFSDTVCLHNWCAGLLSEHQMRVKTNEFFRLFKGIEF